jgi:hypothetical protein
MKNLFISFFILISPLIGLVQQSKIDSLTIEFSKSQHDTIRAENLAPSEFQHMM